MKLECAGCGYEIEEDDLNDDGLCAHCAKDDEDEDIEDEDILQ